MEIEEQGTNQRKEPNRVLFRNLVFLVIWITLFTLAYAQSPLYTSNQNQYFLHGFAQAGFGSLSEDWLANTLDPTPVFSKFIQISWSTLPWKPVFYIYFGILAGIFLSSLFGIADHLWELGKSRPQKWLYLAILILLFSVALRYLNARLLGVNWEFLFDGGVAGQRLLGTVFQPSTFGVFLLLSIFLFIRANRVWAIVCLLVAATFHPTYLLSAGILTAVYMGITFWETRQVRPPLILGLGAFLGVLPILWHTLTTFGGQSSTMMREARKILVEFRIPHHAMFAEWFDAAVLVKLGFVGLALIILHRTRTSILAKPQAPVKPAAKLFHILLWPSIIAVSLTVIQVLSQDIILALLFPWRLSTWLVPLSISTIVGWAVFRSFERFQLERFPGWIMAFSAVLALIFAAFGVAKFQISWEQKQGLEERDMMAFVEANKQPGQTYLIPLKMQDFRLETGAPAFIEFKSIPYKDVDVLEWRRRVDLVRNFYNRHRCKKIPDLLAVEGITHVVLPRGHLAGQCIQLEKVEKDQYYGVYKILIP